MSQHWDKLYHISFCAIELKVFSALLRIMFERLQKKWNVSGLHLALILCTFAIGGSATGFVGKKIMNALSIQQDWLWAVIYILLVTIIWPLAVLIVSIPFGQFPFFIRYIKKIGEKMGIVKSRESVMSQESGVGSSEPGVRSQESEES